MYHKQLKPKPPYSKKFKYGTTPTPKAQSKVASENTLFGSKTKKFVRSEFHTSYQEAVNYQSELHRNSAAITIPMMSYGHSPIQHPANLSRAIVDFFADTIGKKEFKQAVKFFDASSLSKNISNWREFFLQIVNEKNPLISSSFERKRHVMLTILLEESNPIQFVNLLMDKDINGSTLLHDVLRSNDHGMLRFYFEQIIYMLELKWITAENYHSLLIDTDRTNTTPLLQVLRSGNTDNIQLFLQKTVATDMPLDAYRNLLLQPDQYGVTPLHEALQAKNTELMYLYVGELMNGLVHNRITSHEYCKLLTSPDNSRITPLHYALKSANPVNVEVYCNELKFVFDNNWIDKKQYTSQLITSTPTNGTPLVHALSSGNYANAFFYFQTLIYVHKMGLLDDKKYGKALTTSSSMKLTPLHYLVQNELIAMMHILIPELNKALSPKGYKAAVNVRCDGERLVCSGTTDKAKKINTLLAATQKDAAKALSSFFQQQEKNRPIVSKPVVRHSVRW